WLHELPGRVQPRRNVAPDWCLETTRYVTVLNRHQGVQGFTVDVLAEETHSAVSKNCMAAAGMFAPAAPAVRHARAGIVLIDSPLNRQNHVRMHVRMQEWSEARTAVFLERSFDHQHRVRRAVANSGESCRTVEPECGFPRPVPGSVGGDRIPLVVRWH